MPRLNLKSILKIIRENQSEIKNFGVKKIGLFGSFSKRKETIASDIDFLVDFEEETFDSYMGLKFYLEDVFKRPVDLVLRKTVKPRLRNFILREAIYAPGF